MCRIRFSLGTLFILMTAAFGGCGSNSAPQVEHVNVSFDVSPDGKQIVFSSADGDLHLFDLNSRTVSQLTATAAVESAPSYSPDGESIVYASTADDKQGTRIFQVRIDGTGAEQLTSDADVSDSAPSYSPDGSQIAFARAHRHRPYSIGGWTWDNWDVYVMDASGGNAKRLTRNNHYGLSRVEFSADGSKVFFSGDNNRAASDLDTNVFEVAADGSAPPKTAIPQPTAAGKYAAWGSEPNSSADGKKLVVVSDRAAAYQYDLVLIDLASGNAKALGATSVSRYNQHPAFAPDNQRIFFLAGTQWNAGSRPIFSLWSVGVDGKNAQEIADSELFTAPSKWRLQK